MYVVNNGDGCVRITANCIRSSLIFNINLLALYIRGSGMKMLTGSKDGFRVTNALTAMFIFCCNGRYLRATGATSY